MNDLPARRAGGSYGLPSLVGKRVLLRPVADSDYNWLYNQVLDPGVGGRWRMHGVVPSFAAFTRVLHGDADVTFMVATRDRVRPLGMIQLLRLDERHRFASLSAFFSEEAQQAAWPLEGLALYLRHVFFVYDLRKIYLESLAPDLQQYESLVGSLLVEEGRLKDHERVGDAYYDSIVLALYRDAWADFEPRVLPRGL